MFDLSQNNGIGDDQACRAEYEYRVVPGLALLHHEARIAP